MIEKGVVRHLGVGAEAHGHLYYLLEFCIVGSIAGVQQDIGCINQTLGSRISACFLSIKDLHIVYFAKISFAAYATR